MNTIYKYALSIPQIIGGKLLQVRSALTRKKVITLEGTDVRIKVDPSTGYGQELLKYRNRPTELFIIPLMRKILRPGDVFADVGAHWGIYSMVACQMVGEKGRVLAIEPFQGSYRKIQQNRDLNRFRNLLLVNKAVGEKKSQARLVIKGDGDNLNHLLSEERSKSPLGFLSRSQGCEVSDLKSILDEFSLKKVRMAKIDIEGGEGGLLKDLIHYMDRFEAVLIELHPDSEDFMSSRDLIYRCLSQQRKLYVVDAVNRAEKIMSLEDFQRNLSRYYFLSVLESSGINL
jgi:FkbM family methyltransferase